MLSPLWGHCGARNIPFILWETSGRQEDLPNLKILLACLSLIRYRTFLETLAPMCVHRLMSAKVPSKPLRVVTRLLPRQGLTFP